MVKKLHVKKKMCFSQDLIGSYTLVIISSGFVSCYFYCAKHQSKEKHLLLLHNNNNKIKVTDINIII